MREDDVGATDVAGWRGGSRVEDREVKGLMLPDVVLEVRGNCFEDMGLDRLQIGNCIDG